MFRALLSALVMLSLTTPALARGPHLRGKNQRELRADRQDRNQLQHLLKMFLEAKAAGQTKRLVKIDAKVMRALGEETRESRRELAADTREVKRDRRALARRKRPGRKLAAAASLADDHRDRAKERGELATTKSLRAQYKALVGKTDPASLAAKEALLRQAIASQRKEIAGDKAERREDRRARRSGRVR